MNYLSRKKYEDRVKYTKLLRKNSLISLDISTPWDINQCYQGQNMLEPVGVEGLLAQTKIKHTEV